MLKLAQSIVQIMCNNNYTMCESHFLTLHFVINKVDVLYAIYLSHTRKRLQIVDVLRRPVCAKTHICFTLINSITLHLLFFKIF